MRLTRAEFARQARDALANLYDPVALQAHPLARILAHGTERAGNGAGGAALRARLIAAIEDLKPGPQVDPNAKAWRRYRLLKLRYAEAHDAAEVQRRLALGKSQYYREHEAALASLVAVIEELTRADRGGARADGGGPEAATPGPEPAEGPHRVVDGGEAPIRKPKAGAARRWWVIGGGPVLQPQRAHGGAGRHDLRRGRGQSPNPGDQPRRRSAPPWPAPAWRAL
jgi:hypothetical protein